MEERLSIAIIGAGAAGCFCAINLKRMMPDADVHLFESKSKALAKVAVTGGGRCNLTNTFRKVRNLQEVYPRGEKLMRRALSVFSQEDTCAWFEKEGVRLVAQEDECVFPESQDAMQIVNILLYNIKGLGIQLHLNEKVTSIDLNKWNRVVVTTGGHPTPAGFSMLEGLDIPIEQPVPSLFTFNVQGDWHQLLMGTVVEEVQAFIPGTKFRSQGALLLTHWGMSGPAILRLSSYVARYLAEHDYQSPLCINWMGPHLHQPRRGRSAAQRHGERFVGGWSCQHREFDHQAPRSLHEQGEQPLRGRGLQGDRHGSGLLGLEDHA